MLSRRRFVSTLGSLAAASSLAGAVRQPVPIKIGSRRQLLFDDFLLSMGSPHPEDIPYNIRWVQAKARKSVDKSMLDADRPWEDQTHWVCVLRDQGKYRLWYNASLKDTRLYISYAESDDGLTWRKPILNLVEKNGSKANNIVFAAPPGGAELGSVFIDPAAAPTERYKMFYPTWDREDAHPDVKGYVPDAGVIRGAYSPDGLHWTQYPHIFFGRYTDTQNIAAYDPALKKYVAYLRWFAFYGGADAGGHAVPPARRGRSLARMESDDYLRWTSPELVLAPDFQDGLNVEIYNSGYARYEAAEYAHFMFPSFYHKREGTFHVQVAASRDNRTWSRPVRDTLIPPGPAGSFDDFIVAVAPGFVTVGADQLALYYRSGSFPHSGALHSVKANVKKPCGGMGRVTMPRDRIIGIEAGAEPGAFATRPLLFGGGRLVVNAEPLGPEAELRVQLISATASPQTDQVVGGHSFEDSVPLTADSLDGPIVWRAGTDIGAWSGKPVRLHFRMKAMRLYAFQFVG